MTARVLRTLLATAAGTAGVTFAAASEPSLVQLADDRGFDVVYEELQKIANAQPVGKKRDRAFTEAGLDRLEMPVIPIVGASLSLTEVQPLRGCTYGDTIACGFSAQSPSGAPAADFRVICKSSFGGTIALETEPTSAEPPGVAWRVLGVERCWKLGGVSLAVMPAARNDLDGIGAGDDFIPPELAMLSQVEAEKLVTDRGNQFRYCAKKNPAEAALAKGVMKVRYAIAADGSVADAQTVETTFEAPETQRCILDVFRRIRFPPPAGGFEGGTYPITML